VLDLSAVRDQLTIPKRKAHLAEELSMARQKKYKLQAASIHGAIFDLDGFMADDDQAALNEGAKIVRALIGSPALEAGAMISIIRPDGTPLGMPASVLEFLKRQ
jgi:hypothetical protein